jgi:hypothetical protein
VVISAVKDNIRTILAVMAGLAKFCPIPPNSCLTTATATIHPITASHIGIVTGKFNASSIPVTQADKSPIVCSRFISLRQKYSVSTLNTTHKAIKKIALPPKYIALDTTDGKSAIITISIIFCVEILSRLCGDAVTIKLLKISTLSVNYYFLGSSPFAS